MKFYESPEIELRKIHALAILTASGDKDEWESDIVPDEEEEVDPEDM